MPNAMTHTAFAKVAGMSRGRVSQLVAEGLPVDAAGRIEPKAGLAWIATHIDPDRRRGGGRAKGTSRAKPEAAPKPEDGGTLQTVSRLRMHKLARESQILDIELKRRNGEVVDRKTVERVVFGRARFERDAWIGWSAKTAQRLAAETGADPAAMFPALDKVVREHLAELAATALELKDA